MLNEKILNKVLYFNKHLFCFGLIILKLCSFCKQVDKAGIHTFAQCSATKMVWRKLINYFQNTLYIPEISLQSAMFDFLIAKKKKNLD